MDTVLPVFLLAGGEIFLGLVAARVAVWVVRGWRDYRRGGGSPPPRPRGPGGGLRVLTGGRSGGAAGGGALREAA
jgi:hypothetical protein